MINKYVPAKEIANQTDIIIARTIKDPKDAGVKESAVALNFRHILSQISLKAKKSGGGSEGRNQKRRPA